MKALIISGGKDESTLNITFFLLILKKVLYFQHNSIQVVIWNRVCLQATLNKLLNGRVTIY